MQRNDVTLQRFESEVQLIQAAVRLRIFLGCAPAEDTTAQTFSTEFDLAQLGNM